MHCGKCSAAQWPDHQLFNHLNKDKNGNYAAAETVRPYLSNYSVFCHKIKQNQRHPISVIA